MQRRAYQAFGELDPPTPERKGKLESNRLGDLGTTAEEGAPWTEDEVRKQRLFFNCWYREGTPLTGRSTLEVEKEAIAWAKIGLTKVGDVIDMTKETFRRRYPWLKMATYENLREEWPEAWKQAIAVRRKGEPTEEKTTIGCKETLQTKGEKGILVEFGGSDWAAGCDVAHVFSHTYISPAVRHTPHTRIHCAAMLACEAPDPLARNTGVRSQGVQIALGRIPDMESLPRLPLDHECADWRGLRMPVREIARQRSSQVMRWSNMRQTSADCAETTGASST